MTDLVEYNIYLTGWDTKLVSLCTHSIENSFYKCCGEVAMICREVKFRVNLWALTKKMPICSVGHCRKVALSRCLTVSSTCFNVVLGLGFVSRMFIHIVFHVISENQTMLTTIWITLIAIFIIQANLSMTATLETKESGCC